MAQLLHDGRDGTRNPRELRGIGRDELEKRDLAAEDWLRRSFLFCGTDIVGQVDELVGLLRIAQRQHHHTPVTATGVAVARKVAGLNCRCNAREKLRLSESSAEQTGGIVNPTPLCCLT